MLTMFIVAICIVVFGIVNYDKMSYKATYYRNKKNDVGYYWGGKPRNSKTAERNGWKEIR